MGRVQHCTFRLNGLHLGLEVLRVQEVLRHVAVTRVPRAPASVAGLINLRGRIVTAVDLRSRFGFAPRNDGRPSINVVIRTPEGPVALLADEIGDVEDVDAEGFEPPPDTLDGEARRLIRGAYKLENGLLLVLDADAAVDADVAAGDGRSRR
ncbi:MAG TPA: chemotaxis protein CheW [Planctomycetota bacterium]|nr:chemotaxis protein CheW [Planctomycetota bacterium]